LVGHCVRQIISFENIAWSRDFGTEGCSGYFDGIGRVEGATLAARPPPPPPADPDDSCVISASRYGAALEVREDKCLSWHGASCDFDGKYKKR
jgi:hypothetical protein